VAANAAHEQLGMQTSFADTPCHCYAGVVTDRSEHPLDPALPGVVGLAGAALALSAFLPLTPDGESFATLVVRAFGNGVADGLLTMIALGAPFWFGLSLAAAYPLRRVGDQHDHAARALTQSVLSILHAELILVAATLAVGGHAALAWGLFGFAAVTGSYFAYRCARFGAEAPSHDRARGRPSLWWLARWGAVIVGGVGLWIRAQWFFGAHFGIAVDVTTVTACIIATRLRIRDERPLDGPSG